MRVFLCSFYGDIELRSVEGDATQTRMIYARMTPREALAVNSALVTYNMEPVHEIAAGEVILPDALETVAGRMRSLIHEQRSTITVVRFTDGTRAAEVVPETKAAEPLEVPAEVVERIADDKVTRLGPAEPTAPKRKAKDVAVVQKPERGCPMPAWERYREDRARQVLRKFISPQQRDDFDRELQFIAIGGDTQDRYLVRSRWHPDVGRTGVVMRLNDRLSICASNLKVPPAEECLSMAVVIEHFEIDFLRSGHGGVTTAAGGL